jgi:hypothetical protein
MVDFPLRAVELNLQDSEFLDEPSGKAEHRVNGYFWFMVQGEGLMIQGSWFLDEPSDKVDYWVNG